MLKEQVTGANWKLLTIKALLVAVAVFLTELSAVVIAASANGVEIPWSEVPSLISPTFVAKLIPIEIVALFRTDATPLE